MKESVATIVEKNLSNVISDMGLELYEVDYSKKPNGMNLTLYIYKEGENVTIDDCERVHRKVDSILDDLDPTHNESYYLNVSSVGLDKPLKSDKDFIRCKGQDVEIKLFEALNGEKEIRGVIEDFDSNNLIVQINNKSENIPRKNIALCKLHIEF